MQQRVNWAILLLSGLHYDLSENNLTSIVAWETAEGGGFGNEAANNPLNCTLVMPGSWNVSPTGPNQYVQGYPDETTGINATIQTLQNGDYDTILSYFIANEAPENTAVIIGQSPWGTNGNLIAECIPESAAAVNQFFEGVNMTFIKESNGDVWWFIGNGLDSYWRPVPADAAKNIPDYMIIPDNNGALLAMWKH